jgi:S-formylglutathione hydrolase FrmB
VLLANGGDSSYFHDRHTGRWDSYLLPEAIREAVRQLGADETRVAIGGISMGGFGALDLGRLKPKRFCAVGGHSPALWKTGGETPQGAFDDAEDFARHDLFGVARRTAHPYAAMRIWIDVGRDDPFRDAASAYAALLRKHGQDVSFHLWPGGHTFEYGNAHMGSYLRFYSRALAGCA